ERDTTVTFRVDATLEPGGFVPAGSRMEFPAGSQVPQVVGATPPGGDAWQLPLLDLNGAGYPLLGTLSVLIATSLGTMGLPHVIMRFHTSPDGRAARRTAAITVGLLGIFSLLPRIYGVLGRVLVPHLYLSCAADTAAVPGLPLRRRWRRRWRSPTGGAAGCSPHGSPREPPLPSSPPPSAGCWP